MTDAAVDAALRSIASRGPDDQGVHRDAHAVLGHTRLSIIDLTPLGHQPMASVDGDVVVVFNGEIYNHHELRSELAAHGHVFRSRTDTEVIVEGYRRWGEGVVERLDGMFALGIYERRRRRLVLARDRCGKKPLFHTTGSGAEVRFASEAKAILASGHRADVSLGSLPTLLSMGYVPAPRSMYRDIAQLEPATIAVFEPERAPTFRRYWHYPVDAEPVRCTEREAESTVRDLLERAVVRRLEADVPVGAFLSGGLDSTIVVGLMARHSSRPVRTFSIGFSGERRYDETRYARVAARAFETEHVEFVVEPSSFDVVEALVQAHDGPFGDSSAIPTSIVSALTRKHVTVALSGDGGDELFCGYTRFLAAEGIEHIPARVRRRVSSLAKLVPAAASARTKRARATRFFENAARSLPERLLGLNAFFAYNLPALIRGDQHAAMQLGDDVAYHEAVVARSDGASVLTRILAHNFETYLPGDLLVKTDRTSMMHSLEVRSPFLDRALIEYVARLPDALKRRGTTTKWILRRAFRHLVPRSIRTRGKMGFGVPLGAWFRGDLRTYLLDHLGPTARLNAYLERRFVDRLVREHLEGRNDHGQRLWLLLTFEVWLRALGRQPGRI